MAVARPARLKALRQRGRLLQKKRLFELFDALLPGVVTQAAAKRVLLVLIEGEPGFDAFGGALRRLARRLLATPAKVKRRIACNFFKYGDIAQ